MAREKQTCKILKEIRQQIAEANDIEFITSECLYKGDCLGTCPKCEAEVRYLEQELRARSLAGKAVVLTGISAGMILMSGCNGTSLKQADDALQGEPISVREDSTNGLVGNNAGNLVSRIPVKTGSDCQQYNKISAIADTAVAKKGEIDESFQTTETAQDTVAPILFGEIQETLPEFPGGNKKLMEYVSSNLRITPVMAETDVQGRVIIRFTVKANGSVEDVEVVRSLHPAYDEEAIRVVKSFPQFIPGKTNGKAADYKYILPIVFKFPSTD